MKRLVFAAMLSGLIFCAAPQLRAQSAASLAPGVREFVKVSAPVVALTHVRVIDGTGSPARNDQTIIISGGKIQSIGDSSGISVPAGAQVLDLSNKTVIPGLVGMHDHMFYPAGGRAAVAMYNEMGFSFPRLYLANGVTSLRTTGAIEPYTDLELKKLIDSGKLAGPKIHVTSPYLEGAGAFTPQMHELTGPDDARETVDYWADEGVTSFKAYMHITRAELAAAIAEVHKRHLKITGHLCSIGFKEAAALGIDDLEHGLMVDTEFDPGKAPDVCPSQQLTAKTLAGMNVEGARIQGTIRDLVAHHVAVTSTIVIFETFAPNEPPLEQRVLDALLPEAAIAYLDTRAHIAESVNSPWPALLKKEMQFERDFVKAGGVLLAGEDPTGYGGDLAGFGDQRELELLVQAGFTPAEAIHIYTENGARFLGEDDRIGTLAAGKQADIVVINGDPSTKISDIEKTELVFKDGIGYDSAKLIASVRGSVGLH
ncbi:MAG TPA: amidohydrolase family protein [Candidatus Limnocylindrales bacterium]|nr:amidohydrolase family protein [Candidatus Limnocylindrales bacterium]